MVEDVALCVCKLLRPAALLASARRLLSQVPRGVHQDLVPVEDGALELVRRALLVSAFLEGSRA